MVKNMLPKRRKARVITLLLSVACACFVAAACVRAEPAAAAPDGPVVVDWRTGIALHGMDPVAYFTEGEPSQGLSALELMLGDVTWRFRNEGNRAAFAESPIVYWPGFGGHDPMAIARGVAAPGSPLIWAIYRSRLYLFHTLAARTAFLVNPSAVLAAARVRWQSISAWRRDPAGPPVMRPPETHAPLPDRPMR